jgi:GTP cyclohydrolase I
VSKAQNVKKLAVERTIWDRIATRRANEPLERLPTEPERHEIIKAAARKLEELFDIFQIDHKNDHNMRDTPTRVASMFVNELMRGRFNEPPAITEFDNVGGFDDAVVVGPIALRSTCAHHLLPIYGQAFIGIQPSADGKLLGLSKYDRIVSHFASRLQIQEELVKQIGEFIEDRTAPLGLAVRISAVHMCKTHRGVCAGQDGRMVTTT